MNADLFFVWLFILAQIGIALVYCFWGYRFFRVIMALYVFIFVYPFAYSLLSQFTSIGQTAAILISVVLSLLAGLLVWKIYRFAVFMCGALAGVMIAYAVYQSMGSDYIVLCVILGIALFILLGLLALKFQKAIIIFVTAFVGAFNLVTYTLFLIMKSSVVSGFSMSDIDSITATINASYHQETLWILPSVAVAVIGILVQAFKTAKKAK